jgi:hypothetical protein
MSGSAALSAGFFGASCAAAAKETVNNNDATEAINLISGGLNVFNPE